MSKNSFDPYNEL